MYEPSFSSFVCVFVTLDSIDPIPQVRIETSIAEIKNKPES